MTGVDILRQHTPATVTQEPGGNNVVIDCSCGAEIRGVMPPHPETVSGALMWLMADHLVEALRAAK